MLLSKRIREVREMAKCPYVDRECTDECKAWDSTKPDGCVVLHRMDRANKLLNFIEKKVGR
tara:strand:+ start:1044 stop:1226 length:183 start_codon:yes stop_codon:yes gene_type:complete